MCRTISFAFALLAVMAAAGWLLVGSAGRATANGVYNPSNTEHTYNPYYPNYTGPCNDGFDNDYDGLIDAADPDCLDPKPLPSATQTSTPTPASTPTPPPPSLGGVAEYPNPPSGGSAVAIVAIAVAMVSLVSVGAGWYAWRRTGH